MPIQITQKRYIVKRNSVLPKETHPRLMGAMAFGARIKAVREHLELTQEAVVERVRSLGGDAKNFSQSTLKDTENRDSKKSAYASQIFHVLGIHLQWALIEQGPQWVAEPTDPLPTPATASQPSFFDQAPRNYYVASPSVRDAIDKMLDRSPRNAKHRDALARMIHAYYETQEQ